ncbi:MAG: SAM-dependent methyltransferase [Actinomycetota bacterium]|nr:SAM-dependent methyltransferase [Actinomycetota bacterium]
MDRALYGEDGFYSRGEGAVGHFRTSACAAVSVLEIFAAALGELLGRVDTALGHPAALDLVDVGGGSGELLTAVADSVGPQIQARIRPCVVERRAAPPDLPPYVRWLDRVPDLTGLLIANEWLDNVALDVAAANGWFGYAAAGECGTATVMLVDRTGAESLGLAPTQEEAAWLERWWPSGARREIGLSRDIAWGSAVSHVRRGLAVAMDYAHTAEDRPAYGTLTGFRSGRQIEPIPDGSCDLTAHVAIDSVAAAGEAAAAATGVAAGAAGSRSVRTLLTDQRTALQLLGVSGRRPDYAADRGGYAAALQRAGDAAELIDPAGLGAFAWLLQGIDLDPAALLH